MALAGELAKYIGNELAKNTGKELATKAAASTLSRLSPKMATEAGASMANKIGNELVGGSTLSGLVPKTRLLDKSGNPVTLYHSTPNRFDKFDDAMLGSNTGYDNTALGHFVTPDKDFSKRFIDIDNVGKTGRTMELQGNIQKPITHPYMAGYKYDDKDLDKIVEDYLSATDNPEFLDELRQYAADNNSSLYDEYMDMTIADNPFEVAGSDRKSLMDNGYDAVEIVEGPKSGVVEGAKSNAPVSSYAVFNGENLRPVRHLPISQMPNSEEVPVSTLNRLLNRPAGLETIENYGDRKLAEDIARSGAEKYLSKTQQPIDSSPITLYHGTPNKFEDFDESLPSVWFSDSDKNLRDTGLSIGSGQNMNIMERQLPQNLKIADEDLADRLTKQQLQDRGYAGISYTERGPNGDETYYEIFNPNKTLRKMPKVQRSLELSPQQQEFFKDSVIRDENGELIPMYHGSTSDFTVFDKSKGGQSNKTAKVGFWFTPNKEGAKKWAEKSWWGDNNPKVYETYLNMKNPFVYKQIDNSSQIARLDEQLRIAEDEISSTSKGSPAYYEAYKRYNDIARQIEDLSYTDPYEQFRSHIYAMEGKSPSQANTGGVGMVMDNEDEAVNKYIEMLKNEGHDGIIIRGTSYDTNTLGGKNDQYVVFDPEQIKNVNNKNPTNNKDIRYALIAALGIGSIIGPYINSQKSVDNIE